MSKKRASRMTPQQKAFVDAYTGNATEAARAAGYKGNDATLAAVGSKLLKQDKIFGAINARQTSENAPHIASREELQAFWTRVLLGQEMERSINKSGEVIEEPPKMRDRLKAAELLGRSNAEFTERQEHSGPGGKPMPVQVVVESVAARGKE